MIVRDYRIRNYAMFTADEGHGSDARHFDPDYGVISLEVDAGDLTGSALFFHLRRGSEGAAKWVDEIMQHIVLGRELSWFEENPIDAWRAVCDDSQMRWFPCGMAAGVVVNAIYDLRAKKAGKPLWQFLSDMSAGEMMAQSDWTDFPEGEVRHLLTSRQGARQSAIAALQEKGMPFYSTAFWLRYSEARVRELAEQVLASGNDMVKAKTGFPNSADDRERLALIRSLLPSDRVKLGIDYNQGVLGESLEQMIARVKELAEFDIHFVEEPGLPEDILSLVKIARALPGETRLACGEHISRAETFRDLIELLDGRPVILQPDANRMRGVPDLLRVLGVAAVSDKVDVIPHTGGWGLARMMRHLAFVYQICFAQAEDRGRMESVGFGEEFFTDPSPITENNAFTLPSASGWGAELDHNGPVRHLLYPDSAQWQERLAQERLAHGEGLWPTADCHGAGMFSKCYT